jgi:hypothetical protein
MSSEEEDNTGRDGEGNSQNGGSSHEDPSQKTQTEAGERTVKVEELEQKLPQHIWKVVSDRIGERDAKEKPKEDSTIEEGKQQRDGERPNGVFTEADKRWLNGKSQNPYDQKRRCKKGLARTLEELTELLAKDFEEVPNLNRVGELFDELEEKTEITREQGAKSLIALSFILVNEALNYEKIAKGVELYPDDASDWRNAGEETSIGTAAVFGQPVEEILSFRQALAEGVKLGKQRYDDVPETVVFDSNTKLYKEPTEARLNPKSFEEGIDADDWRDAVARHLDAQGVLGRESSPEDVSKQDAVNYLITEIELNVIKSLDHRREAADEDVIRRTLNMDAHRR